MSLQLNSFSNHLLVIILFFFYLRYVLKQKVPAVRSQKDICLNFFRGICTCSAFTADGSYQVTAVTLIKWPLLFYKGCLLLRDGKDILLICQTTPSLSKFTHRTMCTLLMWCFFFDCSQHFARKENVTEIKVMMLFKNEMDSFFYSSSKCCKQEKKKSKSDDYWVCPVFVCF